jgi:hypothetical protein
VKQIQEANNGLALTSSQVPPKPFQPAGLQRPLRAGLEDELKRFKRLFLFMLVAPEA